MPPPYPHTPKWRKKKPSSPIQPTTREEKRRRGGRNMTSILPQSLHISNPFPSTLNNQPTKPYKFSIISRATDEETNNADSSQQEQENKKTPVTATVSDASFDSRLDKVRFKYRSGTGKKAEQRKSKKTGSSGSGSKKKAVTLPPVPLKEAVTKEGLKVEFGFTPYTERLNGRLAALGLAALILVELGSGKGLLKYHAPPILFLQVYTVAAAAAVFIKYEKERTSVWPKKLEPEPESSAAVGD